MKRQLIVNRNSFLTISQFVPPTFNAPQAYVRKTTKTLKLTKVKWVHSKKKRSPGRILAETNFNLMLDIRFCSMSCSFFEFQIRKKSNFGEMLKMWVYFHHLEGGISSMLSV
jgi:hypothetical protein